MRNYPKFRQENPYNIFAALLVRLRELDQSLFASAEARASLVITTECEQAVDALLEQLKEIVDISCVLAQGMPQEMEAAVYQWRHFDKFPYVYCLLKSLDKLFHWEDILHSPPLEKLKDGFHALNSNVDETGFLLVPRVKSISDDADAGEDGMPYQRHWVSDWLPGMNQDLKNIYYVESKRLEAQATAFTARHWILDEPILEGKDTIRLAFAPFMRNPKLDVQYYIEDGHRLFSVPGLQELERLRAREEAAFIRACGEGANILICPEMLGDEGLIAPQAGYSEILDSFAVKAEQEGLQIPHLILAPTWWHDYKNELHAFSHTADRLCIQQKQFPFTYPDAKGEMYREDLRDIRREIQILHIPGLGRIVFPICKDALEPQYPDLLIQVLHGTFLLSPSYSTGKTQFTLQGTSGRGYGCYRFWFNACGVGKPEGDLPEYIGLLSCPQTDEPERKIVPQCQGICGGDTDPCLFLLDLVLRGREKGRIINVRHAYADQTYTVQ